MTVLTARPTLYRGVLMRSRLEADFAAWLDGPAAYGLFGSNQWQYEPLCFADPAGQYLPDFVVTGDTRTFYIEVKPVYLLTSDDEACALLDKMRPVWASDAECVLLLAYWSYKDSLIKELFIMEAGSGRVTRFSTRVSPLCVTSSIPRES